MGKIWVEVCLISARGLRRTTPSFFKLQWFAVGWIDPNNKYCTTIDASGSGNPVWKTKFTVAIDACDLNLQEVALLVEVYSREPVFLRSRLLGTATIVLKEFLDKHNNNNAHKSEVSKPVEEVGSFQIRKRNKPRGFVDVSIRVSEEREESVSSYAAAKTSGGIKLVGRHGSVDSQRPYQSNQTLPTLQQSEPNNPMQIPQNFSHGGIKLVSRYGSSVDYQRPNQSPTISHQPKPNNPIPIPPNYSQHHSSGGSTYQLLPPPNVGQSYVNMPHSMAPPSGRRAGAGAGFGMGLGAGALAAGAMIFGDDFMSSGYDVPSSLRDPTLTISTNPPFY